MSNTSAARILGGAAVALVLVVPRVHAQAPPAVELVKLPDGQLQPMAQVDRAGTVRLIYFTGDPTGGDVYYVRRARDAARFGDPIRVNSQPGSVIAIGTVRGAHLALGAAGRPYVAWMGSDTAEPRGPDNQREAPGGGRVART